MRKIELTHLNESELITESFQSKILQELVKVKKNQYSWKFGAASYMPWSKISDSDIQEMSPEIAVKLRKIDDAFIIWVDSDNEIIGTSLDNRILYTPNSRKFSPSSVLALSRIAKKAYVVNVSKSADLRQQQLDIKSARYKSKSDALALRDAQQIAKENNDRYRAIILSKKKSEDDLGAVVKSAMTKYSSKIAELADAEYVEYDTRKNITDLHNLISSLLSDYSGYSYYDKKTAISEYDLERNNIHKNNIITYAKQIENFKI